MSRPLSGKSVEAVLEKLAQKAKTADENGSASLSLGYDEARRILFNAWTAETKKGVKAR